MREVDYFWRSPDLLVHRNCLQIDILQVVSQRASLVQGTSFVDEFRLEFGRLVIFDNLSGLLHLSWVTDLFLVVIDD